MAKDGTTMTETATAGVVTTTTEIGTSATTPWTTTEEGMTNNTRNGKGTRITDATIEEDIFAGWSIGKQAEITIGDRIQTQSLHHRSNERRMTTTG